MGTVNTPSEINRYLLEVEKHFSHLSVSDRTELLITASKKIRSEFDLGGAVPGTLFKTLGPANQYAAKLLTEKGLPAATPQKKGLRNLLLGFFVFCLFMLAVFVWWAQSFFPLFKMNDKDQRMEFLGGRIQMDPSGGKLSFGKSLVELDWDLEHFQMDLKIEDAQSLSAVETEELQMVQIHADNAKLGFTSMDSPQVHYQCQLEKTDLPPSEWIQKTNKVLRFTPPSQADKFECRFALPPEIKIEVKLKNGTVTLEKPQQEVDLSVDSGMIHFYRKPQTAYAFQAQVKNGLIQGLKKTTSTGSKSKKIYPIKLFVNQGTIQIH